MPPSSRVLGLVSHRPRWGLSVRGWWLVAVVIVGSAVAALFGVHGFLAVSQPVNSSVLVMEGWMRAVGIQRTASEFRTGGYSFVVTTGGPETSARRAAEPAGSWADSGAYWLRKFGAPPDAIRICSAPQTDRDRTYTSALALRAWLESNAPTVHAINIVSEDVHARRTRLLFQKALGSDFQVGIIAAENPDYDSRRWWRYSEGVREILGETIAYLYVRGFFWPSGDGATH